MKRILCFILAVLSACTLMMNFTACDESEAKSAKSDKNDFESLGYKTYLQLSGSMEPDYSVGSTVYYKPVEDFSTIEVGDDIVYMASEEVTVCHRVIDVEIKGGVYYFHTYGINNYDRDENGNPKLDENGQKQYTLDTTPAHQNNVLGKVVKKP